MKAGVRKKTCDLDVGIIEAVRRLFDAKTETEAIQRALRKAIERKAIEDREVEDALDTLLEEARFRTLRCIGEVPSRGIKARRSRGRSRRCRTSPPGGSGAEDSPSRLDTPGW